MVVSDEQAEDFKDTVYRARSISIAARALGWAIGIVLCIVTVGLSLKLHKLRTAIQLKNYKPLRLTDHAVKAPS